jgi:hypothetical protein
MRGRQGIRRAVVGMLVVAAGVITSAATVNAAPEGSDNQAAFDQLRQRQEAAWARGDAAA